MQLPRSMKLDFVNAQCRLADVFRQSAYTKFLLDYAASEDRIHALWCEILKEEEKLLVCRVCLTIPALLLTNV